VSFKDYQKTRTTETADDLTMDNGQVIAFKRRRG
jgi:hypothetical protein